MKKKLSDFYEYLHSMRKYCRDGHAEGLLNAIILKFDPLVYDTAKPYKRKKVKNKK